MDNTELICRHGNNVSKKTPLICDQTIVDNKPLSFRQKIMNEVTNPAEVILILGPVFAFCIVTYWWFYVLPQGKFW
jgi:hypothetical protein